VSRQASGGFERRNKLNTANKTERQPASVNAGFFGIEVRSSAFRRSQGRVNAELRTKKCKIFFGVEMPVDFRKPCPDQI